MNPFLFFIAAMIPVLLVGQHAEMSESMTDLTAYPYSVQHQDLADGNQLAYIETGEGEETVLMIHGLGSYSPAWQKLMSLLSEEMRCVAIDLPGYGKSDPATLPVTMKGHAGVVAEFIDSLGLEKVTLMGHSMGAQIAMTLALEFPDAVDRLVLLAPAGFETFSEEEAINMKGLVTAEALYANTPEQLGPRFAVNFVNNVLPEDAQFMLEDRLVMKQDSASYYQYCEMYASCVAAMLNGPVASRLKDISIPVLTCFGENDILIPNRYYHPNLTTKGVGESGVELIPNANLIMIPESGHFVLWDQPEPVSEAILEWLRP